MKQETELVFSDSINELLDRIIKIQNEFNNFKIEIERMMIFNDIDELSKIVKNTVSNNIDLVNDELVKCKDITQKYCEDIDILSNGLMVNKYSKITAFNEAKNIINDEFRN